MFTKKTENSSMFSELFKYLFEKDYTIICNSQKTVFLRIGLKII